MSFPMLLKTNKKGHNSDLSGEKGHSSDLSFYNVWSILLFCLCIYDSDAQSMEANNSTTANNNKNNSNIVITDDIQFGHGYTLAGKRACVYTIVCGMFVSFYAHMYYSKFVYIEHMEYTIVCIVCV